jgi:hypothetical protein
MSLVYGIAEEVVNVLFHVLMGSISLAMLTPKIQGKLEFADAWNAGYLFAVYQLNHDQ